MDTMTVTRRGLLRPISYTFLGSALAFALLPDWLQIMVLIGALTLGTGVLLALMVVLWHYRI